MNDKFDYFEDIAKLVPPKHRDLYWKTVARLKRAKADDDLYAIIVMMGLNTMIMHNIPYQIVLERKAIQRQVNQLAALLKDFRDLVASAGLEVHRQRTTRSAKGQ